MYSEKQNEYNCISIYCTCICIRNCNIEYIQFSDFFISQKYGALNNTVIDTHFDERDRFGRLFTFVARLKTTYNDQNIVGIGLNEQTAIAIDLETMIGVTLGPEPYTSKAYLIMPDSVPQVCTRGKPLTFINVTVQELEAYYNDTFDFAIWEGGYDGLRYDVSAVKGKLYYNYNFTTSDADIDTTRHATTEFETTQTTSNSEDSDSTIARFFPNVNILSLICFILSLY